MSEINIHEIIARDNKLVSSNQLQVMMERPGQFIMVHPTIGGFSKIRSQTIVIAFTDSHYRLLYVWP